MTANPLLSPESPMSQDSAVARLRSHIESQILGQPRLVQRLLIALLADGHLLVEGAPGLAKTRAIKALAAGVDADFHRLQFTPDLLPSDLIGTDVYRPQTGEFEFQQGPIFHNLLLADEINRAPAKVQSALLEAMAERQVSVGRSTYELSPLFLVMATQNPIEQEGTYPLPEAQLDRFLFQILIHYPDAAQEAEVVRRSGSLDQATPEAVLTGDDIRAVHEVIRATPIADHVLGYALRLVRSTRVDQPMDNGAERPKMVADYVAWGAGPRASEYIVLAAKARAALTGSTHVTPDHVREMAKPVLRHRILRNFNAEADRVTADMIVDALLEETPVDGTSAQERRQLDKVIS